MKLLFSGKTKDVYSLANGNYQLKFKDDVTGVDGKFDPGANQVGLKIDGIGKAGLKMTEYFFNLLKKKKIPTHFVAANLNEETMEVKPAKVFGKGLEVICRFKAVGSFYRRYGEYCEEGQNLPAYVEFTLKDDKREDPLITEDGLKTLNILTKQQYDKIVSLQKQCAEIVREEMNKRGLDLYDIKLEFGQLEGSKEIVLIDEISGGNMRVYKGSSYLSPLELNEIFF